MKLNRLIVNKLYGIYHYDIEFNKDITFIYGLNGCGKTTILNITEAIITGRLFYLFNYDFFNITLEYSDDNEKQSILINKFDSKLSIEFCNNNYEMIRVNDNDDHESLRHNNLESIYFSQYDFLKLIKETFNYVYLPLNRSSNNYNLDSENEFRYNRHIIRNTIGDSEALKGKRDNALTEVELLIFNSIRKMNLKTSVINDDFRNQILESALDISEFNIEDYKNQIIEYDSNKIKKISKDYSKLLTSLDLMNDSQQDKITKFFDQINKIGNSEYKEDKNEIANLIMNFREIIRIEKLIQIANKMEKEKEKVWSKKSVFISTINEFLKNSADKKEIIIDEEGRLRFIIGKNKKPINVHFLSSGERQLIIFFANLIFGVEDKNGIFVVDEPELSLHLSWQKIFVKEALNVNPQIQMIFATHSPEFVGAYRNKMVKLEKVLEE